MNDSTPADTRSEEEKDYLLALGEFINQFARNEAMLHVALRHFAGINFNMGSAILSGVHTDTAMTFIRRLNEVNDPGQAVRDEIDYIFAQLKSINTLRNHIVHYGSRVDGDVRVVSNQLIAHADRAVRRYAVSPEILRAATYDLNKIIIHISFRVLQNMPQTLYGPFDKALREPWQYKPRQLGPNRPQPPDDAQEP